MNHAFEELESKVTAAAQEIKRLKNERAALAAEIEFMRSEHRQSAELIRRADRFADEKRTIRQRLEKILKKISSVQAGT